MNVSAPFIRRPIATSLLAVAVLLAGALGYRLLPISALPQVDFPTILITTQYPGASADSTESLITAPLERQLGQIASLQIMTSSSSFGLSQITLQFELVRNIDAAAQDVQAAINAAATLPKSLPYPPTYAKVNPADNPILILALTSDSVQERVDNVLTADAAVAALGSFIGASGGNVGLNQGRIFVTLKPLAERQANVFEVIERLRHKLSRIAGISVYLTPTQDLRVGARSSKSQYQFTLWSPDFDELQRWVPRVLARLRALPGLVDVSTDREQGGLQLNLEVDRTVAARLGIRVQDIDDALGNAFSQRQIATI